jgi:hypothetical protein
MKDYIFLGRADASQATTPAAWESYIAKLREAGVFDGGSAIGSGEVVRKDGAVRPTTDLNGYIRVRAENLEAAKLLVEGNPAFECGASIEIRELPRG